MAEKPKSTPAISGTDNENYLSDSFFDKQPQKVEDEGKNRDTQAERREATERERKWAVEETTD